MSIYTGIITNKIVEITEEMGISFISINLMSGAATVLGVQEISGMLPVPVPLAVNTPVNLTRSGTKSISGVTIDCSMGGEIEVMMSRGDNTFGFSPASSSGGAFEGLTNAQLRATPVSISGTVTANTGLVQPLTNSELRAAPVPISGNVTADTGLTQPLTDAQLRATAVPIEIAKTSFYFSALNGSTAQLGAYGSGTDTFTGAVEEIVNQQSYSILLYSDQNGILTINQFIDNGGAFNCMQLTFPIMAGQRFARSGVANGNYFQTIFQNTGSVATQQFNLNTAFGTIPSATQLNNAPSAINEIAGNFVKQLFRTTFANTLAGADPTYFNTIVVGSGQSVSQASGSLILTSGTTANKDTILRSTQSFYGSLIVRAQTILSQRIANNNFFVELVDVIGDGLNVTINSATSITVTIPNNSFTSANVGQGMYVGNFNGFIGATTIPSRYVIASVSGNNVNFTVAGFVLGSVNTGTCSLFGWNYYKLLYSGTTATNALYDAQRRGWNSGDTTATINTTAGVGHMAMLQNDEGNAYLADQLVASSAVLQATVRSSRVVNLPEETTKLFLQIRCLNGTVSPASNTTWTIGTISIEGFSALPTTINNIKPQGLGNTMPVSLQNAITGTVTATLAASAVLAGDFGMQYRANATGAALRAHIISAATTNATIVKNAAGRLLGWSIANTSAEWKYVKLHNQSTLPTAGAGVVQTIGIPPNAVREVALDGGIAFTTGIGLTTVTGVADNNATAVALNDLAIDIFYA